MVSAHASMEGMRLRPYLNSGPLPDPPVEVFHNSGELGLMRHHLWKSRMTQLEDLGGTVAMLLLVVAHTIAMPSEPNLP